MRDFLRHETSIKHDPGHTYWRLNLVAWFSKPFFQYAASTVSSLLVNSISILNPTRHSLCDSEPLLWLAFCAASDGLHHGDFFFCWDACVIPESSRLSHLNTHTSVLSHKAHAMRCAARLFSSASDPCSTSSRVGSHAESIKSSSRLSYSADLPARRVWFRGVLCTYLGTHILQTSVGWHGWREVACEVRWGKGKATGGAFMARSDSALAW